MLRYIERGCIPAAHLGALAMPRFLTVALAACFLFAISVRAEEPKKELTQAELIKKLEQDLTGAKLTGSYTVTGKENATPKAESYTIQSATKLDEPDLWLIKAQMSYGGTATTYPIPLEIKWAGDTPVITMTNMEIPKLGTFSTRIVLYEGRYAGTWQHGKAGGHLFGTIEKLPAETPKP
jgi:hypothetical protein